MAAQCWNRRLTASGVANYANEAGRATLKQYLQNVYVLKTVTPEMPADAEAFERGQTAMFIRESWVIGDIASKAPNLTYADRPAAARLDRLADQSLCQGRGRRRQGGLGLRHGHQRAREPEWLLKNVGWLPNRSGVDYSSVTNATPAFSAFVNYPRTTSSSRCPRSGRSRRF